jgi:hypothetical protein
VSTGDNATAHLKVGQGQIACQVRLPKPNRENKWRRGLFNGMSPKRDPLSTSEVKFLLGSRKSSPFGFPSHKHTVTHFPKFGQKHCFKKSMCATLIRVCFGLGKAFKEEKTRTERGELGWPEVAATHGQGGQQTCVPSRRRAGLDMWSPMWPGWLKSP